MKTCPPPTRWEDFTECFPAFCKEEGDRAQGVFNTLSKHMESALVVRLSISPERFTRTDYPFQKATDEFFVDTELKRCIDDLHAAVVDAKLRKQRGEVRPDIWREDLNPRAATRARTVPLLERERERLLAELQEVSFSFHSPSPHPLITHSAPAGGRKPKTPGRN